MMYCLYLKIKEKELYFCQQLWDFAGAAHMFDPLGAPFQERVSAAPQHRNQQERQQLNCNTPQHFTSYESVQQ